MATVLDEILESFYTKLAESDAFDDATMKELRVLFTSDKKMKADDLVAILEKAAMEETP